MSEPSREWKRSRYEPGGGNAVVFYIVYGTFGPAGSPPAGALGEYRSEGLPAGVELQRIVRDASTPVLPFLGGELVKLLRHDEPALVEQVEATPECLAIEGEVKDPGDLNHLRDTIGEIAWWFDHGAVAVLDVQRLKLYDAVSWWLDVFAPFPPRLLNHVVILAAPEPEGGRWVHTRGLRKFGRPDLSMRRVASEHQQAVVEMFNHLILLQAEGARLQEGQAVRMSGLPEGITCHHAGRPDDPAFNNVHVEFRWPGTYSF